MSVLSKEAIAFISGFILAMLIIGAYFKFPNYGLPYLGEICNGPNIPTGCTWKYTGPTECEGIVVCPDSAASYPND